MTSNLFKGAKFGDKFITRDGKIAIFSRITTTGHAIYFDDWENRYMVLSDGRKYDWTETEIDIVSRYKEPIDERKLDELARKVTGCLDPTDVDDPNYTGYHCYIAGYRKAME